jgi:hypothetical protein
MELFYEERIDTHLLTKSLDEHTSITIFFKIEGLTPNIGKVGNVFKLSANGEEVLEAYSQPAMTGIRVKLICSVDSHNVFLLDLMNTL